MAKKKKLLLRNLLKFNENIQNRKKILKFNKKKWDLLRDKTLYEANNNDIIFNNKSQMKQRTVTDNKNKLIYDQTIFYTPTFYNKVYKKIFRVNLKTKQKLTFFYGTMPNNYLKKIKFHNGTQKAGNQNINHGSKTGQFITHVQHGPQCYP